MRGATTDDQTDHDTGSRPADALEPGASDARQALLERWLTEGSPVRRAAVGPPRRPPGSPTPLSIQQRRTRRGSLRNAASPAAYNLSFHAMTVGGIDAGALREALEELTARHEALRMCCAPGSATEAVVAETLAPDLRDDRSAIVAGEALARQLGTELGAEAFDLERAPLVRVLAVRCPDDRYLLGVSAHHLVMDGYSLRVALEEFAALYLGRVVGKPARLPPVPVQYPDFALWQIRHVESGGWDAPLQTWRDTLRGMPVLELPADRPRKVPGDRGGAQIAFDLGTERSDHLRSLARRLEATPFLTLVSAFVALLSRMSGQADVAIGTQSSNRGVPGTEAALGYFSTSLVLRLDASGNRTFAELVGHARERWRMLNAHDQVVLPVDGDVPPLDRLGSVEDVVDPEGRAPGAPLVQAVVVAQPPVELAWPGLGLSDGSYHAAPAGRYDLALYVWGMDGGTMRGMLEHSLDRFEPTTASDVIASFQGVLDQVIAQADTPLSRLAPPPPRSTGSVTG